MLALTRRTGEGVTMAIPGIGRVRVLILKLSGNYIRLGFDAPPEIVIFRDEIQEQIDRDQSGSASE